MNRHDILARENNLSRRTHSHSWDKEGFLTVTTEVSSLEAQRSETFQNVYKCTKADTDLNIKLARAEATDIFLAIEPEVTMATTTAAKTAVVEAVVESSPTDVTNPVEEAPKPAKKKRASRKKAPVEAAPVVEEAPIHIAPEVAAPTEDDGLGDLGEEAAVVNYTKGDKLHAKILGSLLVSAYGKDWQKDEKVKVIVRGLVSAIKDTVPVVDDKGTMLGSFSVFIAEYLKKAA